MVQWLGAFTAGAQVQFLGGELRSSKLQDMALKKKIHSLLQLNNIPLHVCIHFIYPLICCQLLLLPSCYCENDVINTVVQVCLRPYFGIYLEVELLDHMVSLCLAFLRN